MTTSVPTTKPPGEGWRLWMYSTGLEQPYHYAEVELWREGWTDTHLTDAYNNRNPYMNVYGLYWRPAGPRITDTELMRRVFADMGLSVEIVKRK